MVEEQRAEDRARNLQTVVLRIERGQGRLLMQMTHASKELASIDFTKHQCGIVQSSLGWMGWAGDSLVILVGRVWMQNYMSDMLADEQTEK